MSEMNDLSIPESALDFVEMTPAEDMALWVLRNELPDVPVFTLVPLDPPRQFIQIRGGDPWTPLNRADQRLIFFDSIEVQVFTRDPNGDEEGALLSNAVYVALRDACIRNQRVPFKGWVKDLTIVQRPRRKVDWVTPMGPVQYADLPTGAWRYEALYGLRYRRDATPPQN